MITKKETLEIITALNKSGFNLVEISNSESNHLYILAGTWEPVDNKAVFKHTIKGQLLNNLLDNVISKLQDTLFMSNFISKVGDLQIVSREYSSDYSWITYNAIK